MRLLVGILAAISILAAACSGATSPSREPGRLRRTVQRRRANNSPSRGGADFSGKGGGSANNSACRGADRGGAGRGEGSGPQAPSAGGSTAPSVAQPTTTQPQPQATPVEQPVQQNRLIIYTTSLTVLVTDLFGGVNQVSDIATSLGGFVAGVEQHFQDENPSAIVRLKVPADKYQAAMNRLRSQGVDARDEITNTEDVTEEYNDLQTQLSSLEATYAQYLVLMKRAQTVDEILQLQQRIDEVKLQIDRIKGRSNFLSQQAALATITVTVRPAQLVLVQEYGVLVSQQRQLQAQQSTLLDALKRAKTPEEENSLRQQLSQVVLQLEEVTRRVDAVKDKALKASIKLPTDDLAIAAQGAQQAPSGEELGQTYVNLRVDVRRKELEQQQLLEQLRQTPPPANADDLRKQLQATILDLQNLNEKLKAVQARAQKESITLPEVDPGLLCALVGGGDAGQLQRTRFWAAVTEAWDASISVYYGVLVGLAQVLVLLWLPILILAIVGLVLWRVRPGRRLAPTMAAIVTPVPPATPTSPAPPAPPAQSPTA